LALGTAATPERHDGARLEHLDRGLVAATTGDGVFLSWRLLGDEVTGHSDAGLVGTDFHVYRNENGSRPSPTAPTTSTAPAPPAPDTGSRPPAVDAARR